MFGCLKFVFVVGVVGMMLRPCSVVAFVPTVPFKTAGLGTRHTGKNQLSKINGRTLFHGDSPVIVRESNKNSSGSIGLGASDQGVLGTLGTLAALMTLFSEYTLKTTGCGLPAGPLGLVGLAEGLSYVSVVGIGGLSMYSKVKTGSGLPAGPAGLLGAAEGLSFLAIVVGFVVLAFQVSDFGYIPNAVPMEGGMCS